MFSYVNFSVQPIQMRTAPSKVSRSLLSIHLQKRCHGFNVSPSQNLRRGVFSFSKSKSTKEDFEPGLEKNETVEEDQNSILSYTLNVDNLLLFGVDGVLPELVNGRCAMIGLLSGIVTEFVTKTPLTDQFAHNVSNGTTLSIIGLVTFLSLLPAFILDFESIAYANEKTSNLSWTGRGIYKHTRDSRFRGGRAYAVDPALLNISSLPHIRTPLGTIGFVPFSEIVNARFSMALLLVALLFEGALGHGIF